MQKSFFSQRGVSTITLVAMLVSQFAPLGLYTTFALDSAFVANQTTANAAAGTNNQTHITVTTIPNVVAVSATGTSAGTDGSDVTASTVGTGANGLTVTITDDNTTDCAGITLGGTTPTYTITCDLDSSVSAGTDLSATALTALIEGASDLAAVVKGAGGNTVVADTITLAAGVDAVAQVDTYTPANVEVGDSFRITIGATDYDFVATLATVQNVVEGLQLLVDVNAAVTCTEDDLKVTCTADAPGTAFVGSSTTTNLAAVAQVVTFTPATPTDGETFSGSINGTVYNYIVTGSLTVAQAVTGFQPLIDADAAVVCTDDVTTVTCTAATPGTAFTYDATVVDITASVVTEVTPVTTPTSDTTPSYTFASTQTGTINYGGDCSSTTTGATVGSNAITFVTLADGVHTNCTVSVTDAASNTSNVLAVTAFTVDITAPTVALTTGTPSPTNGAFTVTTTFSEAVTGFDNSDLTVANASKSSFSGVSSTVYTVLITPTTDGIVTVDVATGAAMDTASNDNTVAIQLSLIYDTVAPAISSISITPNGGGTGVTYSYVVTDLSTTTASVYLGTGSNVLATLTTSGSSSGTGTHTGSLSGLTPGTYYYYVGSTDAAGNTTISSTGTFSSSDSTEPVISNKHVDSITETSATVKFDFTDASYTVGTGTGYITLGTGASLTNQGTGYLTITTGSTNSASSAFGSLSADTTYNYALSVTDNFGNTSATSTGSFVTASTPVTLTGGTITETGATTLTGATITVGTTFDLSGTTIIISSDLTDTNSITGSLTLSGVTGITVSGSTSWNGILIPPILIQSGSTENASNSEISTIIPQTTIVTVGSTTTTTTYTSTILETVKIGGENGVSLIASGSNFRVSFIVALGTVGDVFKLYRSTDGITWEVNSPDLTCTLDASKMCTFDTNHLSFFAPTRITTSISSVTASSGGGGGGSYTAPYVSPVTNTGTIVVPPTVFYPTGTMSSFTLPPIMISNYGDIRFRDVANNWAGNYINSLVVRGIVNNVEFYRPDDHLTRAEFLKIVIRTTGWTIPTKDLSIPFDDITMNSWYAKYISLALSKGMVSSVNLSFRPNYTITRAESAKILMIALGVSVSEPTSMSFVDVNAASDLAKYIEAARSLGVLSGQVVNGKKIFRPNDSITRAEIAKIVAMAFHL